MLKKTKEGIILTLKVIPKASSTELITSNPLKLRLKAVPEKNKANLELISFLSKTLSIPKSKIKIISGKTSQLKRILLIDQDLNTIKQKLLLN